MAELLGTVSSAIAVAEVGLKVGATIFKLKRLWDEVQEVPESIRSLLMDIEILAPLLQEFESQVDLSSHFQSDASAKLSVVYCRAALQELKTLIDGLSKEVNAKKRRKKYVGRLKVVLNNQTIANAEAKLRRTVDLFHSSQINHLM